ncbi:Nsp3 [Mobuck virus]|uniref:Nsp3 n=1 Tax=Mobuck virus TaxID=1408137 RepID=UPI0003BA11D5|nr:Nsp3 [Mobuck virus]AGX89729.1 Nsp3 [Mobuck virus]
MHAAIQPVKRENPIPLLTVVPASAPAYEKVFHEETKQKETLLNLTVPDALTARTTALDVLSNALGAGSGTDEITRRERSAYGAAAQALNEDESTRRLKVYMNRQIIPRLEQKYRTSTIKYRLWVCVEIFFAFLSIMIFGVMGVTEWHESIDDWMKKQSGIKVGVSTVSMICTMILLYASRSAGGLKELRKRLKRELIKRQTYNDISGTMGGTETHGGESDSRLSNRENSAWINAPGVSSPASGWQLMRVDG